jgi:hypothetical protein
MLHKKGAGGLAQGVGPEFKPQKKKMCITNHQTIKKYYI